MLKLFIIRLHQYSLAIFFQGSKGIEGGGCALNFFSTTMQVGGWGSPKKLNRYRGGLRVSKPRSCSPTHDLRSSCSIMHV